MVRLAKWTHHIIVYTNKSPNHHPILERKFYFQKRMKSRIWARLLGDIFCATLAATLAPNLAAKSAATLDATLATTLSATLGATLDPTLGEILCATLAETLAETLAATLAATFNLITKLCAAPSGWEIFIGRYSIGVLLATTRQAFLAELPRCKTHWSCMVVASVENDRRTHKMPRVCLVLPRF